MLLRHMKAFSSQVLLGAKENTVHKKRDEIGKNETDKFSYRRMSSS